MSKNEIKLTVNVSDDLIEKVVGAMIKMNSMQSMGAVSYTHLTLPTNREV